MSPSGLEDLLDLVPAVYTAGRHVSASGLWSGAFVFCRRGLRRRQKSVAPTIEGAFEFCKCGLHGQQKFVGLGLSNSAIWYQMLLQNSRYVIDFGLLASFYISKPSGKHILASVRKPF